MERPELARTYDLDAPVVSARAWFRADSQQYRRNGYPTDSPIPLHRRRWATSGG